MADDEEYEMAATVPIGGSGNNVSSVATTLITYPFEYVKTLIQIGYEPLPSHPTRNIFGHPRMALPNVFTYLGFIIRQEGHILAIYRGLPYYLVSRQIHDFVYDYLQRCLTNRLAPPEPTHVDVGTSPAPITGVVTLKNDSPKSLAVRLKQFVVSNWTGALKNLTLVLVVEGSSKLGASICSYPFHLLSVRSCCQFVGKENIYDSPITGIKDIINNEGPSGFYSGFVPQVTGEVLQIVITKSVEIYVIKKLFSGDSNQSLWASTCLRFIVPSFLYRFKVLSKVMMVNSCESLEASRLEPHYIDWLDCWQQMSRLDSMKRGSSLFFRYEPRSRFSKLSH
ncbi:mitochondrial carrier homolog 2-like [Brevipalpus obovatus]|uniref:mitochondrial carrier homolog 2-like n=1 Tax=Brevipalpus obovatus TaxID=246614 RepID=UPI003D9DC75B